jgi:predicted 3-demethylubiquinone-9 3-methyltransferase (glyoxalase superfamily)
MTPQPTYVPRSQIVPSALPELLADPDRENSQRVMQAMPRMRKIEIEPLQRAASR